MIDRRSLLRSAAVSLVIPRCSAGAQTNKLPRVALVFTTEPLAGMAGPDPVDPYARAFVHALRDLGLVDGRNVLIVRRSAEGQSDRFATLMHEMVELDVNVIVTFGSAVIAAQRASKSIAIVGLLDDPLAAGVADSLARPGHNVTGIGTHGPEIDAKRLQLLKEAAPSATRIAVIAGHLKPGLYASQRAELSAVAGRDLGLGLRWLEADTSAELESAFTTIELERTDAVFAGANILNFAHRHRIAAFAVRRRLPSIGLPDCGMLMDYASDLLDDLRHMAVLVKKIIDGAKPGDLPFEQPTVYRLTINLRTAKEIGLTIPQSLLVRADEVIR